MASSSTADTALRPNCYHRCSRNLQQTISPPLHGGGQGFESPRLHFQKMLLFRRNANQESAHQLSAKPLCKDQHID